MSRFKTTILLLLSLAAAAPSRAADEAAAIQHPQFTAEQVEFFSKEIRPLLAENCFKCHGNKDAKGHTKAKSGLQLISRRGLMTTARRSTRRTRPRALFSK
jgi:cytochrome c553